MHSHLPLFVRVTVVFLAFSAGLASLVLSVPPAHAQGLVSSDLYRFRSVGAVARWTCLSISIQVRGPHVATLFLSFRLRVPLLNPA